jgi:CheY-like chemotaxis protein
MAAWLQDRIYSRTTSGDAALASQDVAIPSDYRRILRVIEGETHSDVIRGRLRHYADELLADWLAELEELGFVSSVPADATQDLDFSGLLTAQQLRGERTTPDDSQRMGPQAAEAAFTALEHSGAFLSPDRLKNRSPLAKKPTEIRVLIVEDDPDQAALADLRVSMAGYEVRLARNCKELVQEIRAREIPDVVLLDIMLPDGNGFDVLASIRRHPKLALLPVIMLTALGHPEQVRRGLALGADGYITKPYSKKILTDTISAVLKHA